MYQVANTNKASRERARNRARSQETTDRSTLLCKLVSRYDGRGVK